MKKGEKMKTNFKFKMILAVMLAVTVFTTASLANPSLFPYEYTDTFEGPTLNPPDNPFWTVDVAPGSQVSLSTDYAHSGQQSLREYTGGSSGGERWARVFHDFGVPVYGSASIWLYDTAAGSNNSNYLAFDMGTPGGTDSVDLEGPDSEGDWYSFNRPGVSILTNVPRTLAWHEFMYEWDASAVKAFVDGQEVYAGPGGSFQRIYVSTYGPDWRPVWTSYWDDFQVSYVPEPATLTLLGLGSLAMLRLRRAS
jgi:hypothetical protein